MYVIYPRHVISVQKDSEQWKSPENTIPINNSIRQLIRMHKCLTKQNHNRSCQK